MIYLTCSGSRLWLVSMSSQWCSLHSPSRSGPLERIKIINYKPGTWQINSPPPCLCTMACNRVNMVIDHRNLSGVAASSTNTHQCSDQKESTCLFDGPHVRIHLHSSFQKMAILQEESLGEKPDNCGKTLLSLVPGEKSEQIKADSLEGLSGPLNISCNTEG